jgi:hypothetical protein
MDWKGIGKKLLFPPIWLMALLVTGSAAALVYVFVKGLEQSIPAYAVYVISFYGLVTLTAYCAVTMPRQYRNIRQKLRANTLTNRLMTDRVFRVHLSLASSFGASMLYVAIHVWSWSMLRSWWFLVLAVYYSIMAVMRFLLVRYVRIQKIGTSILGEWKRARICACILLLVNLSLSGAVLMILYQSKGYDYPGIMIYVMALYTFYSTIIAIVNIIKYRKLGSPVMSAARIVSLCGALVSMLNLETAMFSQFGGDMAPEHQRIFIILTGAGVSVSVVSLSLSLIRNAAKELRRIKNEA